MNREFRILSTTAILGYGFPLASFEAGLAKKPHLIAVDAGSTDPGPYYLGAGVSFTDRNAVKRDLAIMIAAGLKHGIPVVVGSAGGSGADAHLDWCRDIVSEIVREEGLSLKMAVIRAEIPKDHVKHALRRGQIQPLHPAPQLTEADIDATTRIVAQMGEAPFIAAFDASPDLILAGRAYDPVCFASLAIKQGFDRALATHLGKILECAAICATPGSGSDCMFGTVYEDSFIVEPLNPARQCTTLSVAAHTLYEKTNPYILYGPGGHLDLTACQFEQEGNAVRVRGTVFVPSAVDTVKLEGAKPIGFRTVSIAGARDPVFIESLDAILEGVQERVADNFAEQGWETELRFHVYGRDGVMASREPLRDSVRPHELGILIEATAPTQPQADTICAFARSTLLHYGYPGRRATAGNLAFPYSPSDFHAGEAYVFSIYHLMEIDAQSALFPVEIVQL